MMRFAFAELGSIYGFTLQKYLPSWYKLPHGDRDKISVKFQPLLGPDTKSRGHWLENLMSIGQTTTSLWIS